MRTRGTAAKATNSKRRCRAEVRRGDGAERKRAAERPAPAAALDPGTFRRVAVFVPLIPGDAR